jgi:hypothetical protein
MSSGGSRKWFIYETDNLGDFAVFGDESNYEAVNGAVGDYANADTFPVLALPRNLKMRRLRYRSEDGLRTRLIPAMTAAIFATPPNPITIDGASLRLSATLGEEITAPLGFDTALQDGDAT